MRETITALKFNPKHPDRVDVYLDHKLAFTVTEDSVHGLREGQRLTLDQIKALQQAEQARAAYQTALRYLAQRQRSTFEVEQYLRRKGFADGAIHSSIARLRRAHYLDDAGFVRAWIEHRRRFKPLGRHGLRYELRRRGLSDALIDPALDGIDENEWAWAALTPRLSRWKDLAMAQFMRKAGGYLSRRGFSYETVYTVVRQAWQQCQNPA